MVVSGRTVPIASPGAPRRGLHVLGVAAGVAALALALVLPWSSVPGGALGRVLLARRGVTPAATGVVWRASPRLAVLLAGLLVLGVVLVVLRVRSHPRARAAAFATSAFGLALLVLVMDRLVIGRPGASYTTIGAGGLLGLAGVLIVVLGALPAVLRVRAPEVRFSTLASPWPEAGPWGREGASVPTRPSRAWVAAGLLGLLVVYVVTRAAFAYRFPYFLDEGLYAQYAKLASRSTTDLFIPLRIGQGPMLGWLSVVWIKLGFGPLTAVRLVSLVSGLLTAGVIGWLARCLWGPATGWVAAALAVVVPFFLVHDGIGIYEPLVTLILTTALLLQLVMARRPSLRVAGALGLVIGAGVLTKANTLPALALLPVSLLCFDWSPHGRRRRLRIWLLGAGIVLACVVGASLLPHTSRYYTDFETARKSIFLWPVRSVHDVLRAPYAVAGLNWDTFRPALVGYIGLPLLAAALAGAVLALRHRMRMALVLLAWILVPFAIAMALELRPAPRHAMYLVPPLVLLASHALVEAARLLGRTLPRRAALGACVAGAALVLAPPMVLDARVLAHPATARYPGLDYWQYVAGWTAGGPWGGTADALARRAGPGRTPIVTPGDYGILRLLLAEKGTYEFVAPGTPAAARARFAVIDSNAFPIDPKGLQQRLIGLGFAPVARFARPAGPCSGDREPDCGGVVTVFERPAG